MPLNIMLQESREKLDELCRDNSIIVSTRFFTYPIVFTFIPKASTQIRLDTEEQPNIHNASMELVFGEYLKIRVTDNFQIDADLFNKIKNLAKKVHYLYLQEFHEKKMAVETVTREAFESQPEQN